MFIKISSLAIYVVATVVLFYIAWRDSRTMEIPDGCHFIFIALGVLQMLCGIQLSIGSRVIGAFVVAAPMLLVELFHKDSFGGGDIKMCGSVGFFLGAPQVLAGSLMGLVAAGLFGAAAMLVGRKGPRDCFPLGPFLSIGFTLAIVMGQLGVALG